MGTSPSASLATPHTAPPAGTAPDDALAVARAVAAAVRGVPGVADVVPGRFATAATYGPGEIVRGVAVRPHPGGRGYTVEVHLRADYTPALSLPWLAERVRRTAGAAARALTAGPVGPIDVAVDDLRFAAAPAGPGDPYRPGAPTVPTSAPGGASE